AAISFNESGVTIAADGEHPKAVIPRPCSNPGNGPRKRTPKIRALPLTLPTIRLLAASRRATLVAIPKSPIRNHRFLSEYGLVPLATPTNYADYRQLFAGYSLPLAFVDLGRLEANGRAMAERARHRPIRVATKSIRSVDLLR